MQDETVMLLKFAMWGVGLVLGLVNAWLLYLIKTVRDSINALNNKMERNEREHVEAHAKLYEKINENATRVDREFVHKNNLAEFKREMKEGFAELKSVIQQQQNKNG